MTRVTIEFKDLSYEKQEEIYEALAKENVDISCLSGSHEIYIHCDIDEDEITFE